MDWRIATGIICCFGVFKDFRPSDSYITAYLIDPEFKNLTMEQVNNMVYPVWVYSYLATLVLVLLLTDFLRYKVVIIFEALSYISTWVLLLWGHGLFLMQLMQFTFGCATSTEIAYYSYIYAAISKKHYRRASSFVRASSLVGRFMAALLAQLLLSLAGVSFFVLNAISFVNVCICFIVALLLPGIRRSFYFEVEIKPEGSKYCERGDEGSAMISDCCAEPTPDASKSFEMEKFSKDAETEQLNVQVKDARPTACLINPEDPPAVIETKECIDSGSLASSEKQPSGVPIDPSSDATTCLINPEDPPAVIETKGCLDSSPLAPSEKQPSRVPIDPSSDATTCLINPEDPPAVIETKECIDSGSSAPSEKQPSRVPIDPSSDATTCLINPEDPPAVIETKGCIESGSLAPSEKQPSRVPIDPSSDATTCLINPDDPPAVVETKECIDSNPSAPSEKQPSRVHINPSSDTTTRLSSKNCKNLNPSRKTSVSHLKESLYFLKKSRFKRNVFYPDRPSVTIHEGLKRMWGDFLSAYKDRKLLLWSVWWAFTTCGKVHLGNYIQSLYEEVRLDQNSAANYNAAVDAASLAICAAASFGIGFVKVDWSKYGELLLFFVNLVIGSLLVWMSFTNNIWIAYVCYLVIRIVFQTVLTIATYQVAVHLSSRCYGLVFGLNTFLALLLETLMTVIVVDKNGLNLDVRTQFVVYGGYFGVLSLPFLMKFFYNCLCKKNHVELSPTNEPDIQEERLN